MPEMSDACFTSLDRNVKNIIDRLKALPQPMPMNMMATGTINGWPESKPAIPKIMELPVKTLNKACCRIFSASIGIIKVIGITENCSKKSSQPAALEVYPYDCNKTGIHVINV